MPGFAPIAALPLAGFPETTAVNVAVTGVSATGRVGTATVLAATTVVVTGVSATGRIGTVLADASGQSPTTEGFLLGFSPIAATPIAALVPATGAGAIAYVTGVVGTGAVGSVLTDTVVPVTGVYATGAIGTLTFITPEAAVVSGVVGYGQLNNVAVLIGAGSAAFGVVGYCVVGNVTITSIPYGPGIVVSGVLATGRVGNVYVREYAPVVWGNINTVQTPGWRVIET